MKFRKLFVMLLCASALTACGGGNSGGFVNSMFEQVLRSGITRTETESTFYVRMDPKQTSKDVLDVAKNALQVKATTSEVVVSDYYHSSKRVEKTVYLKKSEADKNVFAEGAFNLAVNEDYYSELYPIKYYNSDSLAVGYDIHLEKYIASLKSGESEIFGSTKVLMMGAALGKFSGGIVHTRSDVKSLGIDSARKFQRTRLVKYGSDFAKLAVCGEPLTYIQDQLSDEDQYIFALGTLYSGGEPFDFNAPIVYDETPLVLTKQAA